MSACRCFLELWLRAMAAAARLLWTCDAGRCRPMEMELLRQATHASTRTQFRNWLRSGEALNGLQIDSGVAGMHAARRWGALGRICIHSSEGQVLHVGTTTDAARCLLAVVLSTVALGRNCSVRICTVRDCTFCC